MESHSEVDDALPEDLQDLNFKDLIYFKAADENGAGVWKQNKVKVHKYKIQVRRINC